MSGRPSKLKSSTVIGLGGWGVAGVGAGAEGEKIGGQAVFAAVDLQQYRTFARAEALAALHFDSALPALGQFG